MLHAYIENTGSPWVLLTIDNACNRYREKQKHSTSISERMVHAERTQNANGLCHVDVIEDACWHESAIREFNLHYPLQN